MNKISRQILHLPELEQSLDLFRQIRSYVADVVFSGGDCPYLLPVVRNENDRRKHRRDEQESV